MIKKYLITGLLLWIGSISYAQVMLPAYQGVFSKKILSSGVASNGLDFDGVNDYVSFPNNTVIPLANSQYTLEAYIKPTVHSNNGIVGWGNYGSSNQVNALRLNAGNYIINYWWGNDISLPLASSLADNNWYHIAATFDGNKRKIYVDGVLIGEDTPTGHNVPSAANFRIGSTNNGEFFKGTIDDVRIWNVARTQTQIQATMNTELLGTETGLKAYYTFNQGIAAGNNTAITTVTDKTVNALNGTLTNFAKTGATSNFVVGKVESNIVTSGLVQNLSASNTASYSGTGTAWNDLSGNNNNGTLSGPTYYSIVNGLSIPSLYFNGNGQYVSFGSSPPNFPTGDISVSVWINFSALSNASWNIFMTKWFGGSPADFHYAVKYNGTSYKQNLFTTNSSDLYGTSIIAANTWYCLGFTLKNSGDLQFYVNGVPDGKFTSVSRSNGNSIYYLGDYRPGGLICFTGYLNNVNLYNRTLSSDEMLNNFNATKAKYGL